MKPNNIDRYLSSLHFIPIGTMGDVEKDEFSKRPCDCCGTWLAGERFKVKAICFRPAKDPRRRSYIKRYPYWVCMDCAFDWE